MSDVTAFNNCINVFWRQHEAELSRFLTSKTGDSEKAADLLQELFLRARAHSDSFCEMENPRAWLYRAARNLLIDGYRTTRGTVAKLAMRQPFVLFKGLTFQKLCLPGAFRPGDHHNKMLRPGLCVVHASPQYL